MENQTFGQKAVRVSFNPSENSAVDTIKQKYADIIDLLNDARQVAGTNPVARTASVAITEAETACMWAVKTLTQEF